MTLSDAIADAMPAAPALAEQHARRGRALVGAGAIVTVLGVLAYVATMALDIVYFGALAFPFVPMVMVLGGAAFCLVGGIASTSAAPGRDELHLLTRFLWIAIVLFGAIPRYLGRRLSPATRGKPILGEVLADTLERLGATFVKLGQILGSRPDLLPRAILEGLARLQDAVAPAPFESIERVLERELGSARRARIVHVDPEPMAAASVAQVHVGVLASGERVAIKVQRPDAPEQIERDLAILSFFARVLDRVPSLRLLSLPGAVAQFGDALRAQLDFRIEAANNRRLAASFARMKGVRVPDLHDELCTERVLTMELIEGHKATCSEKVSGKRERRRLAARCGEAILKMIFEDGFVHADLHPGNILFQEDGTIVFIDLGLVAEIPPDLMSAWIDMFSALGNEDAKTAARLFYDYAPAVATDDYAAYEADTVAFFRRFERKRLGDVQVSEVVVGMMNILRKHRIQVDPVFTVMNLAVIVAEGLGKQLDPDIDIVQMSLPYLAAASERAPHGRPPLRRPPVQLAAPAKSPALFGDVFEGLGWLVE